MARYPHTVSIASPDDQRLRVLASTRLLDSAAEEGFDRLTRLATRLLGAPTSLVSLVDAHRQFFKSAFGLTEPWASRRETPLSHSFCQYVVRDRAPLVVRDARKHPVLRDNPAIPELGAIAYAGIPLIVDDEAVGAFCVIDDKPHDWPADKIEILEDLAASVVAMIQLRIAAQTADAARGLTQAIVESMGEACIAIDPTKKFLIVNPAARRIFHEGTQVGKYVPHGWAALHRSQRPDGSPMPSEAGPLGRALRGLDSDELVFSLQKPGADEPVWVDVSGRPVRDGSGNVVAAVAIYRDVTARRKEVDYYAALAGHIPRGAVALFDREMRCLAIDGSLLRAAGASPRDLIGKTMRELSDLPAGDPAFERVAEMYRRALAGEAAAADYVVSGRTMSLHAGPVRDASGAITAVIVLTTDVTHEREVAAALRRSEEIHRTIVQQLPNGAVFVIDRDLRYVSADGPILAEILRRRDLDSLVGRRMTEVLSPEVRDTMIRTVQRSLAGERIDWEIERDGHFYEMSVVPIREDGVISHAMIASYDVTIPRREAEELKSARDSLALQQSLLETTLAHIDEGVALIDGDSRILIANHAFASMLGMPRGMVEGMTREAFVRHLSPFLAEPEGLAATLLDQPPDTPQQFQFARPRRRVLSRTWTPVALAEGDGMLVTWRDVTAEHDLLREREQLLLIDALTGIPNRRAAENAMRAEQQRMKRSGTPFCVALFDIDHFKRVNDVFGHGAGDEVLRVVAASMTSQLRLTDTVARWGGEEFVAVLNVPLDGARIFCDRTRQRVEALEIPPVGRVTISGGVVQVGVDESLTEALERADKLLYQAKAAGRNRVHPPAPGPA